MDSRMDDRCKMSAARQILVTDLEINFLALHLLSRQLQKVGVL